MTSAAPAVLTREKARELVDTFARGWAKGQLDLILQVFATDAVFIETPFAEPLSGTEAIRKYWSDVPYHQSEITVSTGEVFLAGPWFSAEFKSVFRRPAYRRLGRGAGSDLLRDRWREVSEMRMYWHRRP
jgi:hypothetical protein